MEQLKRQMTEMQQQREAEQLEQLKRQMADMQTQRELDRIR